MTNEQLIKKYGKPGENLDRFVFPYPMFFNGQRSRSTMVHKDYGQSLINALDEVAKYYTPNQITELGLDQFGGVFNNRNLRGSADKLSMHAFGCAIDLDPANNQLTWKSDKARFAQPVYTKFIEIMEKWGWYSLGKYKNYDWQHFQTEKP